MLVVFAGLPGTGKTTVARMTADRLGATYLRIDSIEAAITATFAPCRGNPVGYVVAERIAADQLRAGRPVVVDAVNAVEPARAGWRRLGEPVRFVEVVCSDPDVHRRRVEQRTFEMPGHVQPSWTDVQDTVWEPFTEPRVLIDNTATPEDAVDRVLRGLRP